MIVFAHLLNDRSGSPKVLASVIDVLDDGKHSNELFVGSDGSGFLSDTGIPSTYYWYRRASRRWMTLFTYFFSQGCLLAALFRKHDLPREAVIYVNTLLPFGAALFGWFTGRRVVYHLHEVSVTPAPLRWWLVGVARLTASRLIYVSHFHQRCLPIAGVPSVTVHNALDKAFMDRAEAAPPYHPWREGRFVVLMLASLRNYKGVPEFLELARCFVDHSAVAFQLVVNDDDLAIQRYFAEVPRPANLTVYPRTNDPAAFYAGASLVVNLSRPDQWVETFGLTLIEAMAFGIPVIAPPVGGPLELVTDGQEGYLVDSRDGDALAARVSQLVEDESLCLKLSRCALDRARQFSPEAFSKQLRAALAPLLGDAR